MLGAIILITIGWSFLTFFIMLMEAAEGGGLPFDAEGFEFVNPVFIYKHCRVNVFGAIILALLMSLICPLGTVGYWFYKLCTIGRKADDIEDY